MKFFFRDDIMLIEYTTTKVDAPKKVSRMPDNPELLNAEEFASGELRSPNIEQIFVQTKSTSTYNMFDKNELKKISMQDFNPITVLGRGAFGKVMLCEHKKTKTIFAIKSLNKENIIQKDQIEHTRTEKEILTQINHPFLVKLACAFQTPQKLFFVMPFVKGGELFHHLQSKRRFQEHEVKFFAAQLVQALGYLHSLGFAYRDIKPENILVGEDGYIKLTDFGLSKKLAPGQRTMTFVGTPDYMAPEILLNLGHNHMVDWWALGILMYE
jgi:serum/glucocorticoid-regulated kinase 2